MAKQGRGKDPETAARRKLADAQAKLQVAQERRSRVATEGEQEIERARKRAASQLDTATNEVERRAERMARAEAKVNSLLSRKTEAKSGLVKPAKAIKAPKPADSATSRNSAEPAKPGPGAASPQGVADRLEAIQSELADQADAESVVLPNGVADDGVVRGVNLGSLSRYESLVLAALRDGFAQTGATFTDWLAATKLSKRTFLRARKNLVENGLVRHEGVGQGALYFPTDLNRP